MEKGLKAHQTQPVFLDPVELEKFKAAQSAFATIRNSVESFLTSISLNPGLAQEEQVAFHLIIEATQSASSDCRRMAEEQLSQESYSNSYKQVCQVLSMVYKLRDTCSFCKMNLLISFLLGSCQRKIDFTTWPESQKLEILVFLTGIIHQKDFPLGFKRKLVSLFETWLNVTHILQSNKDYSKVFQDFLFELLSQSATFQTVFSAALLWNAILGQKYIEIGQKTGTNKSILSLLIHFSSIKLSKLLLTPLSKGETRVDEAQLNFMMDGVSEITKCLKTSLKKISDPHNPRFMVKYKILQKKALFECFEKAMLLSGNLSEHLSEQPGIAGGQSHPFFLTGEPNALKSEVMVIKKNCVLCLLHLVKFYIFLQKNKEKVDLGKFDLLKLSFFETYTQNFLEFSLSNTIIYLQEIEFDPSRVSELYKKCIGIVLEVSSEASKIFTCNRFFFEKRDQ